jgi:glycosyltransferase involved in cell wall biosynthesis
MDDLRLCFSYTHSDVPSDGGNSFARALRGHLSRTRGLTIVDDVRGDYDVLFMNQLSRGPESPHNLSEIRGVLRAGKNRKLVVRAINLNRNCEYGGPIHSFLRNVRDLSILKLLNMADFVIFQSAFQEGLFKRFGYTGKSHSVIHNGAAPAFLNVPGKVKKLESGDDLILISSAMATMATKKQDIIAALSRVPGVKVIHAGVWPEGLDRGKIKMAGILSHEELARLYARGHYFLHPALRDVCPNSLVEGLCAGLPAIYNPGPGSGSELGGKFGIALDESDLPFTISRAREHYERLATALIAERHYFSIERAARTYMNIFQAVGRGEFPSTAAWASRARQAK